MYLYPCTIAKARDPSRGQIGHIVGTTKQYFPFFVKPNRSIMLNIFSNNNSSISRKWPSLTKPWLYAAGNHAYKPAYGSGCSRTTFVKKNLVTLLAFCIFRQRLTDSWSKSSNSGSMQILRETVVSANASAV